MCEVIVLIISRETFSDVCSYLKAGAVLLPSQIKAYSVFHVVVVPFWLGSKGPSLFYCSLYFYGVLLL